MTRLNPPATRLTARRRPLDIAAAREALRRTDRAQRTYAALLWVGGLCALPVGSAIGAGLTWGVARVGQEYGRDPATWAAHFAWWFALSTPLLLAVAAFGSRSFIEDQRAAVDDDEADQITAATIFVLLLVLLGPGLLVKAHQRTAAIRRFRHVDRGRAAEALAGLALVNDGVPVRSLLRPGEPLEELLPVLAYLVHHDWAGAGKAGDRVWASSLGQKRLAAVRDG